jgi:hypothetical protein
MSSLPTVPTASTAPVVAPTSSVSASTVVPTTDASVPTPVLPFIKCENLFTLLDKYGKCSLSSDAGTFITIYTNAYNGFNDKYDSLMTCLKGTNRPTDISRQNTLWIETLQNTSGIKGLGKKLIQVIKNLAMSNERTKFKYVFLYPAESYARQTLGIRSSGQETLIRKVYEPMGFRKITGCNFKVGGQDYGKYNIFDENAPYTLMFAKLSDLNINIPEHDGIEVRMTGGDPYYQKYLKYKNKYLELKNKL